MKTSSTLLVAIAFLAFVALGLPSGVLNVTWPSIRDSFALTQDAIGALLLAHTVGYMLSSFASGGAISRLGIGRFLLLSIVVAALGLSGYALAPAWWTMVLGGLLAGLGGGAIDAGMNTYFAANHSPTLMNWLHACFGLGASLGPQLTAAVVAVGASWRWGYVVVALLDVLLAIGFGVTLGRWRIDPPDSAQPAAAPARGLQTLRLPAVWLNIGLFFLFTGLEASSGQWSYPLFTEARGISAETAGLWITAYWASLTLGRLLFGAVVSQIGITPLLRGTMVSSTVGAILIWWSPTELMGFVGLALMGFSIAPMFPLSISDTPQRVGERHAANAIGFQVAAASIGIAALPGLTGVVAEDRGLQVVGPLLVLFCATLFLLHELGARGRHAPGTSGQGLAAKPFDKP